VLPLYHHLQEVGGAGNTRVIAPHRLLAFPGCFFDGPSYQLRRILAKIILDPLLILRGWRHDLGGDDLPVLIQGVAVIENAAGRLSDRLTNTYPVGASTRGAAGGSYS
jgi:hypothetical protein